MVYTHYDYLELPPGASSTRIEAAYRNLRQRLNADADEAMVRCLHLKLQPNELGECFGKGPIGGVEIA